MQAVLEAVVRQIYMTAETFAESLDYNYRRGEVDDIPNEPREFAAQYINPVSSHADSPSDWFCHFCVIASVHCPSLSAVCPDLASHGPLQMKPQYELLDGAASHADTKEWGENVCVQ